MVNKEKLIEEKQKWAGVNKYIEKQIDDMLKEEDGLSEVKEKPYSSDTIPSTPILETEDEKWTEERLFSLRKSEQVDMLKKLGVKKIPKYEKDRVKKLLELL